MAVASGPGIADYEHLPAEDLDASFRLILFYDPREDSTFLRLDAALNVAKSSEGVVNSKDQFNVVIAADRSCDLLVPKNGVVDAFGCRANAFDLSTALRGLADAIDQCRAR